MGINRNMSSRIYSQGGISQEVYHGFRGTHARGDKKGGQGEFQQGFARFKKNTLCLPGMPGTGSNTMLKSGRTYGFLACGNIEIRRVNAGHEND